jgi:hypothetical protein
VATTTVLTKGAREFCEARRYRLNAAERDTVDEWLWNLATYPRPHQEGTPTARPERRRVAPPSHKIINTPGYLPVPRLAWLAAPCNKHHVFYPTALTTYAAQNITSAFVAMCECLRFYLVEVQSKRAYFRKAGNSHEILSAYAALPGREFFVEDKGGIFRYKRRSP